MLFSIRQNFVMQILQELTFYMQSLSMYLLMAQYKTMLNFLANIILFFKKKSMKIRITEKYSIQHLA